MKNFKSCAGFCSVVSILALLMVTSIFWVSLKYGDNRLVMGALVAGLVAVALGVLIAYGTIHKKRFLLAVQKERPDAVAFWATAPPNMTHPFGVSWTDIGPSVPATVVVTLSPEAFEIWMDMELKGPTRSLPNTKDLKFNRGIYYFGAHMTGDKDDGTYREEDIFNEAIEVSNPDGDDLVFKTKDLGATWLELEELRR